MLEEIKADLILFLKERGLELSEEKTLITHIDDGVDFLGFNIRKYPGGTLLVKPSEKSLKKFAEATHEIIYGMRSRKHADVIEKLNRMIAGWVRSALPLCLQRTITDTCRRRRHSGVSTTPSSYSCGGGRYADTRTSHWSG